MTQRSPVTVCSVLLQHINTELFRVLIYLSSPCGKACQGIGEDWMPNGSSLAVASGWEVGLPPGLLAHSIVVSTDGCVFAQESNHSVCVCILVSYYFWAKDFHGIFASVGITSLSGSSILTHWYFFSFLIKSTAHKWKYILRKRPLFECFHKSKKAYADVVFTLLQMDHLPFHKL